jgi:hypothetical protein
MLFIELASIATKEWFPAGLTFLSSLISSSSAAELRPTIVTFAPNSASRIATALPIPFVAPTQKAFLPCKFDIGHPLFDFRGTNELFEWVRQGSTSGPAVGDKNSLRRDNYGELFARARSTPAKVCLLHHPTAAQAPLHKADYTPARRRAWIVVMKCALQVRTASPEASSIFRTVCL